MGIVLDVLAWACSSIGSFSCKVLTVTQLAAQLVQLHKVLGGQKLHMPVLMLQKPREKSLASSGCGVPQLLEHIVSTL